MHFRFYNHAQAEIADAAVKAAGLPVNSPILTTAQQAIALLTAHTNLGEVVDNAIQAVESKFDVSGVVKGVEKAAAVVQEALPAVTELLAGHGIQATEKAVVDLLHEFVPTRFNVSTLSDAADLAESIVGLVKGGKLG